MQDQLRLSLLGKLKVERNGQPLGGLTSLKGQALLVYLAVTGQPHSRSALAGLLWSDMPETDARTNLRVTLSQLRKVVGDAVIATRRTVELNPDSNLWLDVTVLEKVAGSGNDLAAVVDLYRGDFLDDFQVPEAELFEEWLLVERERLRQLALSVLGRLTVTALELGKFAEGIAAARRLLSLEPWHEAGHRQLMKLLAATGQASAALAQYETCKRILFEELGVEPAKETTRLYQEIREGTWSQEAETQGNEGARETPSIALPAFLSSAPPPISPVPFVARERELQQLDQHFTAALAGQGRVVFVTGEAGQGKTSLLNEFARRMQSAHVDVIVAGGNCNAYSGVGDPYLPFRDVLGMLSGDVEARWNAGAISQTHGRQLWELLPQTVQALVEHGPNLIDVFVPGSTLQKRAEAGASVNTNWLKRLQKLVQTNRIPSGDREQRQLFEQFTNVLRNLASQKFLLLLLDDLQWADQASINLLFHLGRRLVGSRILILGAYRPSEVTLGQPVADATEQHPLQPVINEFTRQFGEIKIDLSQLSQAEGRGFVDALLDSRLNRLSENFRASLYTKTQGHPLFTVELLRDMRERGDLVRDEAQAWVEGTTLDWHTLPARVEAVIEKRISRLDAGLRETLTLASVEGEEFTAEVVAQLQGIEAQTIVRQLSRELGQRHQLVAAQGVRHLDRQRLSRYRFRHNLFQTYLYNRLDEAERSYLHESVGLALEAYYGDHVAEVAGQLAWHFQAANLKEKALHYLQEAANAAATAYAHGEAVGYLNRALVLTSEGDWTTQFELLLLREGEYGVQGLREAQAQDLTQLQQLADIHGDSQQQLTVALRYATFYHNISNFAESIAAAQQVVRLAEASNDTAHQARGYFQWGRTLWRRGEHEVAEHHLGKASQLSKEAGLTDEQADCDLVLSGIYRAWGDSKRATACMERALSLSQESGHRQNEATALNNLGVVATDQGNYALAHTYYRQAFEIYQSMGDLWNQGMTLGNQGGVFIDLGDYATAEVKIRKASRIFAEINDRRAQSSQLCDLSLLAHYRGDNQTALTHAQQAIDLTTALDEWPVRANAWIKLGHARLGLEQHAAAKEAYQQALDIESHLEQFSPAMEALAGLARVALARQDLSQARVYVQEILDYLEADTLEGALEPFRVYLTCYQVLEAAHDDRARPFLESVYELLQGRAVKIDDQAIRRSFLENVTFHRDIVRAFTADLSSP